MSTRPDPTYENLAALDALRRAAGPAGQAKPPPQPVQREPSAAGPAPQAPETPSHTYKCLSCGYPLSFETGLRCPECGRQFDEATLEAWFSGAERERLMRVLWFVQAALILRLWMLAPLFVSPSLNQFAALLGSAQAVALVMAGLAAGRGRFRTPLGNYAGLTLLCGVLLLVREAQELLGFGRLGGLAPGFLLDGVGACGLMLALGRGSELAHVRGSRAVQRYGLFALFLNLAVFVTATFVVEVTVLSWGNVLLSSPTNFNPIVADLSVYVVTLFSWIWLWVWLRRCAGLTRA